MDTMVQSIWFLPRLSPSNIHSDASVAEFNLNLSLDSIIIDSILHLRAQSFLQPTMVDAAGIDHSICGANQCRHL